MGERANRSVTVGFVMTLFTASFACWFKFGFLDSFCFVMVIVIIDVDGVVGRSGLSVFGWWSQFR